MTAPDHPCSCLPSCTTCALQPTFYYCVHQVQRCFEDLFGGGHSGGSDSDSDSDEEDDAVTVLTDCMLGLLAQVSTRPSVLV